jgi:dipeptidyl aminopeptidase/acylaminoacyl peptidase
MTRWADDGYFLGGPGTRPVAVFSPDQKHFAIIVKKGNIAQNTNDYSLLLYETQSALSRPLPQVLVTMASASNGDGIKDLHWLSDNQTIAYIGENRDTPASVFAIDIVSKQIKRLTNHDTTIIAFDITSDGNTLIYEAFEPLRRTLDTEETRRHGILITTQYPSELLTNDLARDGESGTGLELFVKSGHEPAAEVPAKGVLAQYLPLSLSPDGQYAVLPVYATEIPDRWAEYDNSSLHPYIVEHRRPGQKSNIQEYMLVNLGARTMRPLIDAPKNWRNQAISWLPDGASVIVADTYLPLDKTSKTSEGQLRRKNTFIAEIEVPSCLVRKISNENLLIDHWESATKELYLKLDNPSLSGQTAQAYRKKGEHWEKVASTHEAASLGALQVTLEEDLDTPPKVYSYDPQTRQRALLLDLNPQLSNFKLGKVEEVNWLASDGHEVYGGLYLPPDYKSGIRYPLVIQTHGFDKARFWIDGPWTSAFAAQPLAAKDIVVLQIGGSTERGADGRNANSPREAPRQMAAYEGAIDYLDQRELIDRSKVGIIGFSRTVFHTEYTLTHSKYPIAAVDLADGFDGGYINYLLFPATDYVKVNGGPPVGETAALWLQNSPGFLVDKIKTPVRMEYYGFAGALGAWQWYSGLSQLDKPVEFVWIPFGTHLLKKPWDRLVSQQGSVDWFGFWLKGEIDPDPMKREQFQRWEKMQKLHEEADGGSQKTVPPK